MSPARAGCAQRRRETRARDEEFRSYTWTDVTDEPGSMLDEIRRLVA
jgi:hypothetical protein